MRAQCEMSANAAGQDFGNGAELLGVDQGTAIGGVNGRGAGRMDGSNEGEPTATFAWRRARRHGTEGG